jgi:hypothetical protein
VICAICGGSADRDTPQAEGWVRHTLSVVEAVPHSRTGWQVVTKAQEWTCSLECERALLFRNFIAAGGVARDLEAVERIWTPGKE